MCVCMYVCVCVRWWCAISTQRKRCPRTTERAPRPSGHSWRRLPVTSLFSCATELAVCWMWHRPRCCAWSHSTSQAKAYTTRVGSGPYPTEIFGDLAEQVRRLICV
jgi:hypothetical protein